jgi:hypothetical protein
MSTKPGELQSVTKMWVNFDGFDGGAIRTDVHVGELDNDKPDNDDFYLHSYAVPKPELL